MTHMPLLSHLPIMSHHHVTSSHTPIQRRGDHHQPTSTSTGYIPPPLPLAHSCVYDVDAGTFTIQIPKVTEGEVFEGLDLLTSLLAKRKVAPTASAAAGPLIEVVGVDGGPAAGSERESAAAADADDADVSLLGRDPDADAEELEWEIEQEVPVAAELSLDGATMYGFDEKYTGVLGRLATEIPGIVDLDNPEQTAAADRYACRIKAEDKRWDVDHYAADYAEPEQCQHFIDFEPGWRRWSPPDGGTIAFSEAEQEAMRRLPRKEYMVANKKTELLGLIDIVYAWCYDHRTTTGDPTVESAWTIATLSSTLSFLARHRSVRECAIGCFRRALS